MASDVSVTYEIDLSEPDEELLQWAKENIGEDPDTKCQIISDFRDMIYERGECTPLRTDDEYLLRFLRARHFIIKMAHRLFVNYHEFRENNPEFFENVDLKRLQRMGEDDIISIPPYQDDKGRRMLIYRAGRWDPTKVTVEEIFQGTLFILEVAVLQPRLQILGGILIFDFTDLSMQQALYLTPGIARKVMQIMVTSFPLKIQELHIVNQSRVFDVMYSLFKPFLTSFMKERIFFHGDNMETLHAHVSPKFLPERYGGIHKDYNYKDWIKVCRANDYIRQEMSSLGYKDYDGEDED